MRSYHIDNMQITSLSTLHTQFLRFLPYYNIFFLRRTEKYETLILRGILAVWNMLKTGEKVQNRKKVVQMWYSLSLVKSKAYFFVLFSPLTA